MNIIIKNKYGRKLINLDKVTCIYSRPKWNKVILHYDKSEDYVIESGFFEVIHTEDADSCFDILWALQSGNYPSYYTSIDFGDFDNSYKELYG